jgi:hypothetical protein
MHRNRFEVVNAIERDMSGQMNPVAAQGSVQIKPSRDI